MDTTIVHHRTFTVTLDDAEVRTIFQGLDAALRSGNVPGVPTPMMRTMASNFLNLMTGGWPPKSE